jgi:UDPglucose 6-dehydrogenase
MAQMANDKNNAKISIIGLGFVGASMYKSFKLKGYSVSGYDKFKKPENNIDTGLKNTLKECMETEIMFLALPTLFDETTKEYDKTNIEDVCGQLSEYKYNGLVVIKSTVEPKSTNKLADKFALKLIHNPEFLSAKTAFEDFNEQSHIVLGKSKNATDKDLQQLEDFYKNGFPNAEYSLCTSDESESMKIFCNSFYSVKIQFFNELYSLCNSEEMKCNYDTIKNMMLKNNWINPMHTTVPGTDGQFSYGGYCFPKDTNALLEFMKRNNTPHNVLEATVKERNMMRTDNLNVKKLNHQFNNDSQEIDN